MAVGSKLSSFFGDVFVAAGIAAVAFGGYLFHPGAGYLLIGLALILIGTRGFNSGG